MKNLLQSVSIEVYPPTYTVYGPDRQKLQWWTESLTRCRTKGGFPVYASYVLLWPLSPFLCSRFSLEGIGKVGEDGWGWYPVGKFNRVFYVLALEQLAIIPKCRQQLGVSLFRNDSH